MIITNEKSWLARAARWLPARIAPYYVLDANVPSGRKPDPDGRVVIMRKPRKLSARALEAQAKRYPFIANYDTGAVRVTREGL